MRRFIDAYLNESPEISSLYARPISSLFDSPPASAPWDPDLVDSIRAFNKALGHTSDFDGTEAVVITGQQPAVFGGPLYTIYKALTTIKLAQKISDTHGVPCVPIYWVGSEDHDFEEAATIYFPTKKHRSQALTMRQHPDDLGNALHQVRLTDQVHELIDILGDEAPSGEFREEILQFLHDAARDSQSLAEWSTRCLARLFRGSPLVFFAPHLLAARKVGAQVIASAIKNPLHTSANVNDGAKVLEDLGYSAQVVKGSDECAFFVESDLQRHKVTFDSDTFNLPDNGTSYRADDLLALLNEHPEHFSPNVALRCVIQQTLFPVAAYVAGPGELAYWGQFKGVFDHFEKPMPIVYPRAEAVLTTLKLNKLLAKYNLVVEELNGNPDKVIQKALRCVTQSDALEHFEKHRALILDTLSRLHSDLDADAPVAASMASNLAEDLTRKLERLENLILQADTQKLETVRGHVTRLCESLTPERKPQERMHTIFAYLFEHGWGLMDVLDREIDIDSFTMNKVEL